MGEPTIMFVFPGQGSQYRGMGSDLYSEFSVVRDVYAQASDALGFDVAQLSFEDPHDEIGLTGRATRCAVRVVCGARVDCPGAGVDEGHVDDISAQAGVDDSGDREGRRLTDRQIDGR